MGRSDIKLQTAIGMPVGVDESGNVWVVVMFSPKNVESSSDAIEYLTIELPLSKGVLHKISLFRFFLRRK